MAIFNTPEKNEANPPNTWKVVKVAEGCWHLTTSDGGLLESFSRKTDAEAATTSGFLFDLYHQEAWWYSGGEVPGWRSYSELVSR